jgi:hypothetical protein
MTMRWILAAIALGLAGCGAPKTAPPEAATTTLGSLTIGGAAVRPPLGGLTTAAGYMTIRNDGDEGDRLIGAASPAATSIELHTHRMDGGVARMERVEQVDVPAHATVTFAPGGLHLMLFGFRGEGRSATVTLRFEKAGDVAVPFAVGTPD